MTDDFALDKGIAHRILGLFIFLLLFYYYCFEYVYEIPGIIPILGSGVFISSLLTHDKTYCFPSAWDYLLIFSAVVMISTIINRWNVLAVGFSVRILEYLIPAFGIYTFVGRDFNELKNVFWWIVFDSLALSILCLASNIVTNTGAITANGLNANTMSALIYIGVITTTALLSTETKLLRKIFLLGCILLFSATTLFSASRRGFIMLALFVVFSLFAYLRISMRGNVIKGVFVFLFIVSVIVVCFERILLNQNLVVVQRLFGGNNLGDMKRLELQKAAVMLFRRAPLFGNAGGAVQVTAGSYSHSMFYELIACYGIFGLVVMMLNLLRVLRILYRYKRVLKGREEGLFASIMFIAILLLFVGGYAMVYIYDMYFYIALGIVFAYINACPQGDKQEYSKTSVYIK